MKIFAYHDVSASFSENYVEEYIMLLFYFIAGYAAEGLERCEGVFHWLKSLGEEYDRYATSFMEHMVDGFWLLNYVNEQSLIKYEVGDKKHRQVILAAIQELKESK